MTDLLKAGTLVRNTDAMPRLPQPPAAPVVKCQICKDAGWLRQDVQPGHPGFGKPVRCRCQVRAQADSKCYTWLGDEPGTLTSMTFERFQWDKQPKAYNAMKQLADRAATGDRELPNAFLIGSPGLGKTHLACALLNKLRGAGIACLYCTAQSFFEALYATMRQETDAREVWLKQQFSGTPGLVLDELDKLRVKGQSAGDSYQKSTLCELLDKRYRSGLATIVISNESGSLERWLEQSTLDRLYERCIPLSSTAMSGQSYRQRKDGAR